MKMSHVQIFYLSIGQSNNANVNENLKKSSNANETNSERL